MKARGLNEQYLCAPTAAGVTSFLEQKRT